MGIQQSRPRERALFGFGSDRPYYNNYSGYNGFRRNEPLIKLSFGGKENKTRKMKPQSRKTRKYRK